MITASITRRFWERVEPEPNTGCWLWSGALRNGYGRLGIRWDRQREQMRTAYAHRLAWAIQHGRPAPEAVDVLHRCDNSRCVNPAHLWLGTHADNMRDMRTKGRARTVRGQTNGNAKLSDDQVREIRRLANAGEPRPRIARRFGVTKEQVYNILNGHQRRGAVL